MGNFLYIFIPFIFLIPLLSMIATLIGFFKIGKESYKISLFFAYLAFFASCVYTLGFFLFDAKNIEIFSDTIFCIYVTPLSVAVLLFVSLVSLVIHLYSVKYMFDEEGYIRYFVLLDMMIWVIFGLILSGNLIIMFGFWHMIGVVLYFLLVHNFKRKQTYKYGFYTLFIHMLADIPFLAALYLIFNYYHTFNLHLFLSSVSDILYRHTLFTEIPVASLIAMLIMISALMKSAQFPFHIWLPFTLEGPNPISALMHAGIVNAGAFLANRFAPLFLFGESALHLAFVVGFATAVIGSYLMIVQNDIKKALAYSTMGQMGYMMLEIGSGAFALAVYHMMVHGIFKASLFLGSGGVISQARESSNISNKSLFDFYFKKPSSKKISFLMFALSTLVLPAFIAFVIFSSNISMSQSGIVFFFFAWVFGVATLFSLYKHSTVILRYFLVASLLYALALVFYLFAEHFFNALLFTNPHILEKIYLKAKIPEGIFYILTGIVIFIYIVNWFFAYCRVFKKCFDFRYFTKIYNVIYRVLVRDLYFLDFASKYSKKMINFSIYINKKLKF